MPNEIVIPDDLKQKIIDEIAQELSDGCAKYREAFWADVHGTAKQMAAVLCFTRSPERIAKAEQERDSLNYFREQVFAALGGSAGKPPWDKIRTLREQVRRLSAEVTDEEWAKANPSLISDGSLMVPRDAVNALLQARRTQDARRDA